VGFVGRFYAFSETWWWLFILIGILTFFQLIFAYRWSPILYQAKSELLRSNPAITTDNKYQTTVSHSFNISWWERSFDNPYKNSLALFAGFALLLIFGLPLCWELGLYVLDVDLENSDYLLGWMNLMYVILLILLILMHRKNVLFMSSLRAYATLPMKKNRIFLMIVGFPLLGLSPFILHFFYMLARFLTPMVELLNLMGTYLTTTYFTGAVLIWSVFAFQLIENKKYTEIAGVIWLSVVVGMLSAFSMIKPSDQSHQLVQFFVSALIAIISLAYIYWALHYRSTPFQKDRM
jgi:hypothetical protein